MPAAHRTKPKTVAAYIAAQPPAVRPILRRIRATVRDAAPAAEELDRPMPYALVAGIVRLRVRQNREKVETRARTRRANAARR